MGLISKIKNENTLSDNSINEYKKCKNIISNNSIFKQKLDTIKLLLDKKGVANFDRAHKLLFEPFNHFYEQFPRNEKPYFFIPTDKKLNLLEHIKLENVINKATPLINDLLNLYKKQDSFKKNNENPIYLLGVTVIIYFFAKFVVFPWWDNYTFYQFFEKNGGLLNLLEGAIVLVLRIASFLFIPIFSAMSIYAFFDTNYYKYHNNNELIEKKENVIKKIIKGNKEI